MAGTCLLYKILGSAASKKKDLSYLKNLGEEILKNTFTFGASLSSSSKPGDFANFSIENG